MKKAFGKIAALVLAVALTFSLLPLGALASDKPDKAPVPASSKKDSTASSSTATSNKAKKEISTFGFKSTEANSIYKAKTGTFMVSPITPAKDDFVAALNTLSDNAAVKKAEVDEAEAAKNIEASFLVIFKDGTRRIYTFSKNNIVQAGSEGYFSIPEDVYKKIVSIYTADYKLANFAQWLIMMKPGAITSVSYESGGSKGTVDTGSTNDIVQLVRSIRVISGEYYTPKLESFATGTNKTKIVLNVGDKGSYTVMIDGSTVYVENAELHFGCKYKASADDIAKLVATLKNPGAATPAPAPSTPVPAPPTTGAPSTAPETDDIAYN